MIYHLIFKPHPPIFNFGKSYHSNNNFNPHLQPFVKYAKPTTNHITSSCDAMLRCWLCVCYEVAVGKPVDVLLRHSLLNRVVIIVAMVTSTKINSPCAKKILFILHAALFTA